jgi:hypothetical protein
MSGKWEKEVGCLISRIWLGGLGLIMDDLRLMIEKPDLASRCSYLAGRFTFHARRAMIFGGLGLCRILSALDPALPVPEIGPGEHQDPLACGPDVFDDWVSRHNLNPPATPGPPPA